MNVISKIRNKLCGRSEDHLYDTQITWGMGRPKGADLTGFHAGPGNKNVFTGVLWRGDGRGPTPTLGGDIFGTGFALHKAGVNVSARVTSTTPGISAAKGTTRGVVSMSKDMAISAYWAAANERAEGWLYLVYLKDEEWAASVEWNAKGYKDQTAYHHAVQQKEIMLRGVSPDRVVAARKVSALSGALTLAGAVVRNPNYQGFDVSRLQGDWGLSRFFNPAGSLPVQPGMNDMSAVAAFNAYSQSL